MNNQPKTAGRILGGLLLTTLGVLLITEELSIWDLFSFIEYWPLLLIAVGLAKLLDTDTRLSGIWMISIGSWLQIMSLGLFGVGWSNAWPLLLVFIGVGTLLEGFFAPGMANHTGELHHGK